MLKVFLEDHDAAGRICDEVDRLLFTPPIFLCIGSDRVTGDCLGPITGELLGRRARVFGDLVSPVTALNLVDTERRIRAAFPHRQIIALDSAVGMPSDVGSVRVFAGGLKAGEATGKDLPEVGDIAVTATVCARSAKALSCVRLGLVYRLARMLADSLGNCRFLRSDSVRSVPYLLDSSV